MMLQKDKNKVNEITYNKTTAHNCFFCATELSNEQDLQLNTQMKKTTFIFAANVYNISIQFATDVSTQNEAFYPENTIVLIRYLDASFDVIYLIYYFLLLK